MRFQVAVARDGEGWLATVTHVVPGLGGDSRVGEDRRLPRLGTGAGPGRGFPLPPEDEVAEIGAGQPHRELCASTDVERLRDTFAGLATRDVERGAISSFGSYLFAVLLGPRMWAEILALAQGERIELALRWGVGESELNRLPWEMMRGPDGYLVRARAPEVAITRIVAPEAPAVGAAARDEGWETQMPYVAPRVLFVVGADTGDPNIRWGTEYLAMLRHLQRQELGLLSKLLLRASPEDVRRAIASFRPSVVHFICHGRVEGNDSASLVMRSDEDPDRIEEQSLTALQLGELLVGSDPAPPIVVLNACQTSGQPPSQVSAPMSVELVRQGIPVVIGMWGRVADRVCRLFTRRFYEALLERGRPIVSATAEGRREGFVKGLDPESSADWAFPSVFLSYRVHPELATDARALEEAERIDRVARGFRVLNDPPVFCDRFEIFEAATHLLQPGTERAVLVVRERDPSTEERKYGKTRLLAELAVQGFHEDLAPCLVLPRRLDDLPQSAANLADLILRFLAEARARLQLEDASAYTIEALLDGREDELPDDVKSAMRRYPPPRDDPTGVPPRAVAIATAHDLARFGEDTGRNVLLLLDEVHRFGPGALDLLAYDLLEPGVLATGRTRIPVVLALGCEPHYPDPFKRLLETLRQRPKAREMTVVLKPFPQPDEDPLPYVQYLLLGGRSRYVVKDTAYADVFFSQLWEKTEGVPSRLSSVEVEAFVTTWAKSPLLEEATDEDELQVVEAGRT